jgi:hypothetical protein
MPSTTAMGLAKPQPEPVRAEAELFLRALAGCADAPVTFQAFADCESLKNDEAKAARLARVLHGTLSDRWNELVRLSRAGAGVFVMVNEGDGQGRRESNVRGLRALFVDDDSGTLSPMALELAPSILVKSRSGLHAYWRLRPGEPLDRFTPAQTALAGALGTDPAVKDLPRVMRVPGFLHQKDPAAPFLVRVVETSEVQYTVDEVLEGYGASASQPALLAHFSPGPNPAPQRLVPHPGSARDRRYSEAALEDARAKVASASEGTRNDTLNREAFGLGGLVAGGSLAQSDAKDSLTAAAKSAGLGDHEIRRTLQSGLTAGVQHPRSGPRDPTPIDARGLPVITIGEDMHRVVDEALNSLRGDAEVYSRGRSLVHVVRQSYEHVSAYGLRRQPDAPIIAALPEAVLRVRLSACAYWQKYDGRSVTYRPALPPQWAVSGLHGRGSWNGVRRLEGVTEAPVLRPDERDLFLAHGE